MVYRKDIQILRGLAVVFVVLFHLSLPGFNSGFLGVDVFFVISGFLMAVLYWEGEALSFYARRAKRLLPAYFATILITLIAASLIVLPIEQRQVAEQSLFATVFSSNLGFWQKSSYFEKDEFAPLLHLWSLGVEIQFYLIVPLLAFVDRKIRYSLALLLVGSFAACLVMTSIHAKTSFFMMPFRIWEFLAGYVIARSFSDGGNLRSSAAGPVIGTICLLGMLALPFLPIDGGANDVLFGHPGMAALFATLTTAGVLAFGLPRILEASPVGTALAGLGKYSYSIYLVHFPIIVIFLYEPFMGMRMAPEGIGDILPLLAMIIVASLLMFHLVERNGAKLYSPRRVSVAMACVAGLAFVSSVLVPYRFTTAEMRLFDAWTDRSIIRCGKVFRALNPLSPICDLSDGETEYAGKVLLVGNSHADSIKVSFAKIAEENGYRTFFAADNTPIDSSRKIEGLIEAAKVEAVDMVFLHFSQNPGMHLALDPFIRRLEEENIKTVLIMPTPRYENNVLVSLYNHMHSNQDLPNLDIHEYNKINDDLIKYAKARLSPSFSYFKAADALCSPVCALQDNDGRPLYFDAHHLTLTGGAYLEGFFRDMFKHLKNKMDSHIDYIARYQQNTDNRHRTQ